MRKKQVMTGIAMAAVVGMVGICSTVSYATGGNTKITNETMEGADMPMYNQQIGFSATYNDVVTGPVYDIDITWGSMEFVYETSRTWDPVSQTYVDAEGWKHAAGANQIQITNNSNVDISLAMSADSRMLPQGETPESASILLTTADYKTVNFNAQGQPVYPDFANGTPTGEVIENRGDTLITLARKTGDVAQTKSYYVNLVAQPDKELLSTIQNSDSAMSLGSVELTFIDRISGGMTQ